MKICGIICEYNPFHNGHEYLIRKAKTESGCDAVVCVMSGNFTQRGEPAILNKYIRAKHAVRAGADAVIELPTVFAVSSAEFFAKGAVKLLTSLPSFHKLAFGCESGRKENFLAAAAAANETADFKNALRMNLKKGVSFVKAKTEALSAIGQKECAALLHTPNNILGTEYQKALNYFKSNAEIFPVRRIGSPHNNIEPNGKFSSASAIRRVLSEDIMPDAVKSVPPYTLEDLAKAPKNEPFKKIAVYAALSTPAEELKKILDCSEGLENRLKVLAKSVSDYDLLVRNATTKRYTSSRIRRILAAAVLGISEKLVRESLNAPLYLKILAVSKRSADAVLKELSYSPFPLITRSSDAVKLGGCAAMTYEKDIFAADLYHFLEGADAYRPRKLQIVTPES